MPFVTVSNEKSIFKTQGTKLSTALDYRLCNYHKHKGSKNGPENISDLIEKYIFSSSILYCCQNNVEFSFFWIKFLVLKN